MNNWSVDKLIGAGLIIALWAALAGGMLWGTNDAWTLGRDIVIGLVGYMKGVERKEEQKNG